MIPLWPMNIEPLPLEDSPLDGEGNFCEIEFYQMSHGRVKAVVRNDDLMIIDEIVSHSFIEAYDNVRSEYPRAHWDPFEEDEDEQS